MKVSLLVSVCIPVFSTESYLAQCLHSVYTQNFDSFEIIIVSDASRGKDEKGRNARKIVKLAQKESDRLRKSKKMSKVPFKFIEHRENRGLVEVRRTLCYEASGLYITQCDSDDKLEPGALSALYMASQKSGADITHGTSTAGVFDENENFIPTSENRYGKIFYGAIGGHDVFHRWLVNGDFTANTWGKLIKRDLLMRAYENIPYTECNMAEDVLLFFFLGQYAKSYIGIKSKVYRYRMNTGMSSHRKIDTMQKWKMICSTASVFSVLSTWITENEIPEDEVNKIREMTRYYLANNLKQLHEAVIPELQEQARGMLCDYWGKDFVEKMEKAMKEIC